MSAESGAIRSIWRYPVKSMLGESLESASVTERGVDGDRTYAVGDPLTGRVLSAKREPALMTFRARLEGRGAVNVTFPDGRDLPVTDPLVEQELSELVGRTLVVVQAGVGVPPRIEMGETSATTEGPASEFQGAAGTFFDSAEIHIVTTSSLAALRTLSPGSRIDERRFRPNFLVETDEFSEQFVEEEWVGRRVKIGSEVEIDVIKPCGRCVMVTHAQDELPRDKKVLQTVARRNENNLGVLATVVAGGRVRLGDRLVVT